MLISVHLRRLAREYNVRVSFDKPKLLSIKTEERIKTHTHCFSNTLSSQPIHPFSYVTSITLSLSLTSVPPMAMTTWLIAEEQLVSCRLMHGTLPQMNQLICRHRQAISVQNVHCQFVLVSAMILTLQVQGPFCCFKTPYYNFIEESRLSCMSTISLDHTDVTILTA